MRLAAVVMAVCAALAVLPAGAQKPKAGKQIQCWTDKSGQRMCGDRIPQEYAGQKRDVMKDGRVIETGLTDRVLDDPREPYTQLLVSSILQV